MNNIEFADIAKDVITKDKFQSLRYDPHHGITRYEHVLRVARITYKLSKLFKEDYVSATRGALLHDYFNDNEYHETSGIKKGSLHPMIALNNAKREYELNSIEENVIASHMYPMGKIKPNCKESWLVTSVDKGVAIYECGTYKLKEKLALWLLIFININNMN